MAAYVLKRIMRRPWISLAGLVVAGIFCFVLCYLAGYRRELEEHLAEVKDQYEILCVVTDSRGVQSEKLNLAPRFEKFVRDEEKGLGKYVKEVRMVMEMPLESDLGIGMLIAASSQKACRKTNPALGGSCDYTVEDFFGSSEDICLVPEELYEALKDMEIGARVSVPTVTGQEEFVERSYKVVGRYKGSEADIIVPMGATAPLRGSGGDARTDSLTFVLADNMKAEEMMEKAMEVFTVVDLNSYSSRPALTVQDRQYKATVAELQQNIGRSNYLIPISVLLSLAAGFMIGFLSVRGETRTYALMRTLGVRGPHLIGMVLGEQVLLPALSALVVGILTRQPLTALLYFACHLIGCFLAVLRPALATPTKLLRVQE